MTQILIIDNYDSFVYTLVGYLQQLGADPLVIRNDEVDHATLERQITGVAGVLVSPGPGNPQQAGCSLAAIKIAAASRKPLLGVCLGHQALAEAYGATVAPTAELMHGQTSQVRHTGDAFFADVPQEFTATRYHSLAVMPDTVPDVLEVTATTSTGVIMALRHRELPLYGVQYHPEAVLTEHGYQQLGNWLAVCGNAAAAKLGAQLSPLLVSR
ncbi:anthranilate synthase component II [Canibacter oris]|uniref:Para-aminobenzoate synthetase component 2 n=1 Tax=Canibacter oris TaxID=1365628 RepID=A0A840DSI7_9MICO|nr:gamma-glutamyl-gamma-aminobutyrate hydrolase family protein [Canibacter oris]MBB4072096.1 para-aminobenzoate synthetase component 2 [Canibacter oris]